ncbi:MAG: ABC transporter substrate-binding protein [Thermodesulfobacteriota bacterium]|nr:ABC transporter substrate-binding protein [Thermodesulfobacteriota bacterium]
MERNCLVRIMYIFVIFGVSFIFLTDERCVFAKEVRGVTQDAIKIGAIIDQTGAAASIGIPIADAMRTYFRHINDKGGINGRIVNVFIEDDHYTIPGAVSAFKKLVYKDKILTMLFCGGTGQTKVFSSKLEKEKLPVITVSLAESMTTPLKRYIFTPSASYDDGVDVIVDYIMKDLKAKNPKIAVVYPDVEFGKTGMRAAEKYLKNYNLKLASKTILAISAIDATSQVLTLKRLNPDHVILHEGAAAIISFLKGAKKYGLKSRLFGTFYVSSEDTIAIARDASQGLLAVSPFGFWHDDLSGIAKMREITKQYQPNTEPKTRNYVQGWVTSLICGEGMRRAGRDLSGDTLVDSLETMENFSTGGISSPIRYSKTNHKGGRGNKLYKTDVKKERFIAITEFQEPAF